MDVYEQFKVERDVSGKDSTTPIINYSESDVELLARLMRAEALGDGELGMLMVGNVGVNRIISNCLDYKNINTISDMVYQNPGGFSSVDSPLFNSIPTSYDKELARRAMMGETHDPSTNALMFYAPKLGEECIPVWFNQRNVGRYKGHCFYTTDPDICKNIY